MPFDPNAADLVVGVVGTGAMGRGIAQVAAQGGMRVRAFDEKRTAATAAKDYIAKMLDAQVQKGRLAADAGQAALDRISLADDLCELAQGQCHHRSRRRASRCQAGPVCQVRQHERVRYYPCFQHLFDPHNGHCRGLQGARARVRYALLQPRSAHAAGRNYPRPQDRGLGERRPGAAGASHRA